MAQPVSMTAYRITNKRRKNRTEKKRKGHIKLRIHQYFSDEKENKFLIGQKRFFFYQFTSIK